MEEEKKWLILGFDVRKAPVMELAPDASYVPSDTQKIPPYPGTFSENTWPRAITIGENDLNCFDMMYLPDGINSCGDQGGIQVAFSVDAAAYNAYSTDDYRMPDWMLSKRLGWETIGYDVVDLKRLISGFYGFTWTAADFNTAFSGHAVIFNNFGLIGSNKEAVFCADILNRQIPEHAPFTSVRVWTQKARRN